MTRETLHADASGEVVVDQADFERRIIEPAEFVADKEAFVDVRLERSKGKASYSFIGPGVSQNADQKVNLTVPHGFNVGAAAMPTGVINNPHLHYTAEVFICTRGKWRMNVGQHGEQTLDVSEGDIFSVPTWVFRGFENIGADDGWLFAVLGGDDTGGILWAPHVLREAAETGMYICDDYSLLDATKGDDLSHAVRPLPDDRIESDQYTDAELAARVIGSDDLAWSDRAVLSSVLEGHRSRIAPVIGHGLSQDRRQQAPLMDPHEFSIEWLELEPGQRLGLHRHDHTQATFLVEGEWEVVVNDEASLAARPDPGSIVSTPPRAWRDFVNVGSTPARAVIVCGSDAPTRLEWHPTIVAAASAAGYAVDHSGFVAPEHLLGGGADR